MQPKTPPPSSSARSPAPAPASAPAPAPSPAPTPAGGPLSSQPARAHKAGEPDWQQPVRRNDLSQVLPFHRRLLARPLACAVLGGLCLLALWVYQSGLAGQSVNRPRGGFRDWGIMLLWGGLAAYLMLTAAWGTWRRWRQGRQPRQAEPPPADEDHHPGC